MTAADDRVHDKERSAGLGFDSSTFPQTVLEVCKQHKE